MIVFDDRNPKGLVWLASYPKSGNTWLRAFLFALRHTMSGEAADAIDINALDTYSVNERQVGFYERALNRPIDEISQAEIAALRPRIQQEIATSASGLMLMRTHNAMGKDHGHPLINLAVSAGAVYIVRNPLDVVVSLAHYRAVSVDLVIADMATPGSGAFTAEGQIYFVAGTWSQHVRSWTTPPNSRILVIRYEDMLSYPVETFSSVAQHLRMAPTADQVRKAIDLTTFDRLRAAEARSGFRESSSQSIQFFRAGRADQWRDVLTPQQVDRVVAAHRGQMERFGYLPEQTA